MQNLKYDIVIIGGGSAGVGAAFRASEGGKYRVLVVDKNRCLGGTSVCGGVTNWEPGVTGLGIHSELAGALMAKKMGGAGKGIPNTRLLYYPIDMRTAPRPEESIFPEYPWAISFADTEKAYEVTPQPSDNLKKAYHLGSFIFEPEAMAGAMEKLLMENNVDCMMDTEYRGAYAWAGSIRAVFIKSGAGEEYRVEAGMFIDASGDIALARDAGCGYAYGEDSYSEYNEPSAPETAGNTVNGATLLFIASPVEKETVDEIPPQYRNRNDVWLEERISSGNLPAVCFYRYPNGDINANMLPTMEGDDYTKMDKDAAYDLCKSRLYSYWNYLQTEKGLRHLTMKSIFPFMGIRESYRLKGRYVLCEQDCYDGFTAQNKKEEIIAYADHSLDTHGSTRIKRDPIRGMEVPYGIPYSCLVPNEVDNLLVSCRGASFSHIAASSCRLSRTMMAMGEAAGVAVVNALDKHISPALVDAAAIREKLHRDEYEQYLSKCIDSTL